MSWWMGSVNSSSKKRFLAWRDITDLVSGSIEANCPLSVTNLANQVSLSDREKLITQTSISIRSSA